MTGLDGCESLAACWGSIPRPLARGESLYRLRYVSTDACLTERHTKYLHGSESNLTVSKYSSGQINRFWLFLDADPTVQAIHH